MSLQLTPTWDREGTVTLTLDTERQTLSVRTATEVSRYVLRSPDPDRFGWVVRGEDAERPVTVGEVLVACLREWDAEQAVLELTLRTAEAAGRRGDRWIVAARRLRRQAGAARRMERVSTLPLRTVFVQRRDDGELTACLAAERIGFLAGDRADTSRLRRRLGLAGTAASQQAVSYQTAVELCTALAVDPMEVGL